MAEQHHRLDGHEFRWTLGVGIGQAGLACCSPRGHKESDTTKQLNNSKKPRYVTVLHAGNRMMNKQLFLILTVQKQVRETRM